MNSFILHYWRFVNIIFYVNFMLGTVRSYKVFTYYDTDLYSRLALLYNHKNNSNSNENMYYHWI